MHQVLNTFLRSIYFDKLPKFFARKIFKFFKIFFVDTDLKYLPLNNHPTKVDINLQHKIIENINKKFYKPFNTCSYLLEILSIYSNFKNTFKFYDFGANDIGTYLYLSKYIDKFEYIYHDLPGYNKEIKKIAKEKKWENFSVDFDFELINEPLDFGFFGSSIHYVPNYKSILEKFFNNQTKYLIFAHTPFFFSKIYNEDRVLKQLNIHPTINHLYLLHYNNFIKFMEQNGYQLISQRENNFIKFLNFKNFSDNYSFVSFLDMNFKKKQ